MNAYLHQGLRWHSNHFTTNSWTGLHLGGCWADVARNTTWSWQFILCTKSSEVNGFMRVHWHNTKSLQLKQGNHIYSSKKSIAFGNGRSPPPISAEWPNIPIPPILLISLFNQSTKSCWTIHSHTLTGKCNYNFLCRQHTLSRQSLIPYSMLFADHSNL